MKSTGHKTESVYRRYAIESDASSSRWHTFEAHRARIWKSGAVAIDSLVRLAGVEPATLGLKDEGR